MTPLGWLLLILAILFLGGGYYRAPIALHNRERDDLGWGMSGSLGTLAVIVLVIWLFATGGHR